MEIPETLEKKLNAAFVAGLTVFIIVFWFFVIPSAWWKFWPDKRDLLVKEMAFTYKVSSSIDSFIKINLRFPHSCVLRDLH